MHAQTILVTGASGFIGSHLCKALANDGHKVIGLSRSPKNRTTYLLQEIYCDLETPEALKTALRGLQVDAVIHLAAKKMRGATAAEYALSYQTNLAGTLNLLNAFDPRSIKRFIFMGTAEEYGLLAAPYTESGKEYPISAYGASKLAATQLIQALSVTQQLKYVILRPSVVYGPGQGTDMFLPALVSSLKRGIEFSMTTGTQTRDFLFVDDLIRAISLILLNERIENQIFNLCSGEIVSVGNAAQMATELLGGETRSLLKMGTVDLRRDEVTEYAMSSEKASVLLGWKAQTPLRTGLQKLIDFQKV